MVISVVVSSGEVVTTVVVTFSVVAAVVDGKAVDIEVKRNVKH